MSEQDECDDVVFGEDVLGGARLSDELLRLHPEYPFSFALRGIYDDIWGTTPVPGDPTEGKYPYRKYPLSLKTKAGRVYGLLSALFAQRDNLRELLRVKCQCGNTYLVPKKLYHNPFSDCGCCVEHMVEKAVQDKLNSIQKSGEAESGK